MATTKATTLAHTLGGISSDISTAEINRLDNLTGDIQTQLDAKAPLASPDFTGTVDLTGTTISLDNDQISGDKVSGGTIGAGTFNGTIGSGVTHSVGWQHIETKVGSTSSNIIDFTGIFTDDYVAFDFEMALEGTGTCDCFIQVLDSNDSILTDDKYNSTLRYYPNDQDAEQVFRHTNETYARLVKNLPNNSTFGGFRGRLTARNVTAPTLAGVDTDRGVYRSDFSFTGSGYLNEKYSYATNFIRFNQQYQESDLMGIRFFLKDSTDFNTSRNFSTGSWITCFGLKGKSTA